VFWGLIPYAYWSFLGCGAGVMGAFLGYVGLGVPEYELNGRGMRGYGNG